MPSGRGPDASNVVPLRPWLEPAKEDEKRKWYLTRKDGKILWQLMEMSVDLGEHDEGRVMAMTMPSIIEPTGI